LLGTLLLRSNLEPILAEVTGQWLPPSIIYAVSLLLFLPFLLAATLLWSSAGAVLGAHGARQESSGNESTRLAVRTWWGVTLVTGLTATALYRLNAPTEWLSACLGAAPAGTLALQRLARGWGERTLAQRLDGWLARRFVWRSKSGRRIDLRGEILALVGFLIAGPLPP